MNLYTLSAKTIERMYYLVRSEADDLYIQIFVNVTAARRKGARRFLIFEFGVLMGMGVGESWSVRM